MRGLEVYKLNYYGINVFLAIGRVEKDYVYVYEPMVSENDRGDYLTWDDEKEDYVNKGKLGRFFVPKDADNSFFGKALKMIPQERNGEEVLIVDITPNSFLYQCAMKRSIIKPIPGKYILRNVCDGYNDGIEQLLKTTFITKENKVTTWVPTLPQA